MPAISGSSVREMLISTASVVTDTSATAGRISWARADVLNIKHSIANKKVMWELFDKMRVKIMVTA